MVVHFGGLLAFGGALAGALVGAAIGYLAGLRIARRQLLRDEKFRAYEDPMRKVQEALNTLDLWASVESIELRTDDKKASMEAGRLVLPDHRDLLRELSTFEYRISERGHLLLHHAVGGHDDYPDSLALASRPLTRPRSEGGPPGLLRIPRTGGWWGP